MENDEIIIQISHFDATLKLLSGTPVRGSVFENRIVRCANADHNINQMTLMDDYTVRFRMAGEDATDSEIITCAEDVFYDEMMGVSLDDAKSALIYQAASNLIRAVKAERRLVYEVLLGSLSVPNKGI